MMLKYVVFAFLAGMMCTTAYASETYSVVDATGRNVTLANLEFGNQFTDTDLIFTRPVTLRLVGPDTVGSVSGLVRHCWIGRKRISDSDVTLLLDGQDSITITRARSDFSLILRIRNNRGNLGAITCREADLLARWESEI